MKLYRARLVTERPSRAHVAKSNEPASRIKGRWFTSNIIEAIEHGEKTHEGKEWEIVMVEVTDEFAAAHCVWCVPVTRCGLTPMEYSTNPMTDFVLPTWCANKARYVGVKGNLRSRDYLFNNKNDGNLVLMPNLSARKAA